MTVYIVSNNGDILKGFKSKKAANEYVLKLARSILGQDKNKLSIDDLLTYLELKKIVMKI